MFAKNYRSCRAALCSKERQAWLVGKLYFSFLAKRVSRRSVSVCIYELLCNVAAVCSCCCCALLVRKGDGEAMYIIKYCAAYTIQLHCKIYKFKLDYKEMYEVLMMNTETILIFKMLVWWGLIIDKLIKVVNMRSRAHCISMVMLMAVNIL